MVTMQIYPFSLNQYANEVVKEQKTAEELMNYEWSRYLSFEKFPLDCPMMPIRLAQAGFYYTGHDQEVKCYSCGMTNRDWSANETAVEVHKRLSPGCQFIRGENTDNVEIHAKEYYVGMFDAASHNGDSDGRPARSPSRTRSQTGDSELNSLSSTSGASGEPSDTLNHSRREGNNRNTASNQTKNHPNNNTSSNNSNTSSRSQPTRKGQSDKAATNKPTTANTVSGLSPKHPQYTELAARVGSFMGWTLLDIQDPVELAQAGFFYTGTKDFVRCYYCGVGLKNWERGDDPWSEHSRWSHGCGHLVSSRAAGCSGGDTVTGSDDSLRSSPSLNQINNGSLPGHGSSDHKTAGASGSSDMDSAASKSLMDMGYTQEQVQTAVRKYREQNDTKPLTAVALVSILEADQSLEDASSMQQQIQTNGHPSTGEQSHSNRSNNDQLSSNPSSIGQSHTLTENESERSSSVDKIREDMKKHPSHLEGAKSLLEENHELKSRMQCKICLDRNANMIFLPCGHMVACQTCAMSLRKCAVCRKPIKGSVRVYQT